jgi:cytochrome P450
MAPAINLIDPEYFAEHGHPWDQYEWLRANAPVFWHEEPHGPGFWAITKYEDIRAISQNPKVFSASETGPLLSDRDPTSFFGKDSLLLAMEGPQHDRYRKLLERGFTPEKLNQLRPRIQEIAREILDAAMQKGTGDFVSEIALRLPAGLIAEIMGMPRQDLEHLYDLAPSRHTNDDTITSPEAVNDGLNQQLAYGQSIADFKRKSPGDDLASFWVNDDVEGDRLTDEEFKWFFAFFCMEEGARVTMASGLQLLFDHPDQREKLMSNIDGHIATAIEEMLRFSGPVISFKRTATEDTTIRGQHINAGDSVMLFYASANRDEDVFENPDSFDITRDPNPHVTFGGFGPHQCLGQNLARVEMAVMFKELLTLMPNIRSNGEFEREKSNLIAAIHYLPVTY